jgi:hypothetical protein
MTTLSEACEALQAFLKEAQPLTEIFKDEDLGKILYSALLLKERADGRIGFGPRDIWNTSNQELVELLNH